MKILISYINLDSNQFSTALIFLNYIFKNKIGYISLLYPTISLSSTLNFFKAYTLNNLVVKITLSLKNRAAINFYLTLIRFRKP